MAVVWKNFVSSCRGEKGEVHTYIHALEIVGYKTVLGDNTVVTRWTSCTAILQHQTMFKSFKTAGSTCDVSTIRQVGRKAGLYCFQEKYYVR